MTEHYWWENENQKIMYINKVEGIIYNSEHVEINGVQIAELLKDNLMMLKVLTEPKPVPLPNLGLKDYQDEINRCMATIAENQKNMVAGTILLPKVKKPCGHEWIEVRTMYDRQCFITTHQYICDICRVDVTDSLNLKTNTTKTDLTRTPKPSKGIMREAVHKTPKSKGRKK